MQTEAVFSLPDPQVFQFRPITSFDAGNRPLNYVLNKMLLPWVNLLNNVVDIPLAGLQEINDALRRADPLTYQAVQDTLALQSAWGLTTEVGPALDYASTWLSTNLTTGPYSPFWRLMGSGGVGGGGSLGRSAETLGPELQALGPSEEDVQAWYQLLRESGYQRHHVFAQDLEPLWEEIGFYEGGPYGDIHEYTIAHEGPLHNWLHSPTGGNWVPVQEKWLLEEAIPNGLGPRDAAQFVKDLYERLDIPFDPANLRPFSEGR
jgi:hypothetical protein